MADDYTPTTEEVVNAFAQTGVWLPIAGYVELREAFDRWLAAHDAEKRAEWPEGRRWFTPAYQSTSGNVIAFGDETVVQEHAQRYVDQFTAEDPEGPDYFVATRILPPWMPVEQGKTTKTEGNER